MNGFVLTTSLNDAAPILAVVMALVCVGLISFALKLRTQLSELQRTHRRLRSDAEISHEILATAPDGLFLWVAANNSEACSRRLAVLLGLRDGVYSSFRSVMQCFQGADAKVLMGAAHKLRTEGTPFECVVTTQDGARRLLVVGVRAGAGEVIGGETDEALADVLWMRDVSDLAPPAEGANISAREIIEAMPLPAWLRGGKLGVQAINNAARVLGAADASLGLAERAQASNNKSIDERHLLTDDVGQPHLLDITEAPLPGGGTLGLALDRTRAEETEGTLGRHIQAQNQVLENLATAIAIYGNDQKLTFFNSAFAKLWGLSTTWLADEPTYSDVLERLREQRRLPEVENFKAFKAEQTGQFGQLDGAVETMLHLPDGATLRSVASPHPLGGIVFAYEDVTDHLDLERNYKTLSAVQRETLDNLYEGVAVFGVDGQIKLMNPSFARIWKLPNKSETPLRMSGFVKHITGLVQRDEGDGEFDTIHLAAKLMSRDSDRGRVRLTDGGVLEYAKVPLPDGAVLLSYLDVSDSARVESALLERAHAMAEANVLKSEFMAGVSHEIRTPLDAIVGYASVLSDEHTGDDQGRHDELARGILDSSEELISIIDNMLDLASVEAGLMTLELDTVDVNRLLLTAMNLVRERAKRKDVDIEFDSPSDIGWVVADEKRLKQVLFNLLTSAVTNTPPGGSISLNARREAGAVVFAVTDGGTGLKEDEVPPGLALIARFIELHNGEVELTNRPGHGTQVACHLPAQPDEDSQRQPDLFSGYVEQSD
ncbi:MAG: PAS-domain containing protein [Magnetovibrio sp.]|nr:PAS-domain containing protein [Magnetovibrio sp.]